MSPFEDPSPVAKAGRAAGLAMFAGGITTALLSPERIVQHYERLVDFVRSALAQGGEFDYQRKAVVGAKPDFVQLRQFRNVSNFNVGLFMQKTGIWLVATLWIAGEYARRNSSNYRPDQPYGLDPQTREFIEQGHKVGASGAFD